VGACGDANRVVYTTGRPRAAAGRAARAPGACTTLAVHGRVTWDHERHRRTTPRAILFA
jgi:hypothetical protein